MAKKKTKINKIVSKEFNINDEIKSPEVRLLDEDKSLIGVVALEEALKLAQEKGIDLIEIVPKANPPVCQIIEYNKFMYQLKKKEKEKSKKQKDSQISIKSIRLGANTEEHDYNFKVDKVKNFLEGNNKVQVYIQFKGRQMMYKDRGYKILESIIEELKEIGEVEARPRMTGTRLMMTLAPIKKDK